MQEVKHLTKVLESTKKALKAKDPQSLKSLSDQTLHTSTTQQDISSINLAVIIYTLSKLIERHDYEKEKNWSVFEKNFISLTDLAIKALKTNDETNYKKEIQRLRKSLESISTNLKPYIKDVIRKAEINKASKLYEHGLSMEQTSKLLGITQWELAEYTGQKDISIPSDNITVKQRAKMALGFFS